MNTFEIDVAACRGRQQRLVGEIQRLGAQMAIVTQRENVQWLTGLYVPSVFQAAAALSAEGRLTLVVPEKFDTPAADEILTYEAKWYSTLRNDQTQAAAEVLFAAIRDRGTPERVAVEFSSFGPHWLALGAETVDIQPEIYRLRRRKDADELALMGRAIDATGAMYRRAREIITPGINELDLFNELQAAAVRELGEMLTGTGNDYQCNARGGPPRNRDAQAGELYILDLGPAFRGYFADNCRTISVDGKVTDVQQQAWNQLAGVFDIVERTVRPGKKCRELFEEAQAWVDQSPVGEFNHHLGHGVGLFPHEAPHLNPNWDDTFEAGDLFTVEPGLYGAQLRAGIRLENNYLVTDDGVRLLTDFPLEL